MKKDIENRSDIELLVNNFYAKVKADTLIGPIFTDKAKVNWDRHLPMMYDFWENALFYSGGYFGNPIATHKRLNRMFPLLPDHFQRWRELFLETLDEHFSGEKASLARQKAMSISALLQIKIKDES